MNLVDLLRSSELVLLFAVMALGLLLGRVSVRGVRFGVAGVMFAGLGLSLWLRNDTFVPRIANQVRDVGLVLFVYLVGLSSGPGFFRAWRSTGLRTNAAVLASLLLGGAVALLGGRVVGLDGGFVVGVFTGSLTNTPALAVATERLHGTALGSHPAVGYSLTYPFGVMGALLAFRVLAAARKRQLEQEIADAAATRRPALVTANFSVTSPAVIGRSIGELAVRDKVGVVISRLGRAGETRVPTKYTVLEAGDVVTAVGESSAMATALSFFGAPSSEQLETRREDVDMRRILVSRKALVGKSIEELELDQRFGAQITRLRRADVDLFPSSKMQLELGDRLRVVAPRSRLPELAKFFGDSERGLAEIDFVALTLGIVLGLALGQLPLPLPGGPVRLGIGGGPLLVALVLGRVGHTRGLLWSVPFEASTVLRELGLLLFLAGVGVSAGSGLAALPAGQGLAIVGIGAAVTLTATATMVAAMRLGLRATVTRTLGATSGMQTQPATLAAAYEITGKSDETYVSYAVAYPVAMIAKILLAQVLISLAG